MESLPLALSSTFFHLGTGPSLMIIQRPSLPGPLKSISNPFKNANNFSLLLEMMSTICFGLDGLARKS